MWGWVITQYWTGDGLRQARCSHHNISEKKLHMRNKAGLMENQMQWRIGEEFRNLSITVVNSVTKSLNHSISISVIFFVFVLSLSYRELLLTVPVGYMRDLIWSVLNVFVVVIFLWFSFTGISQSSIFTSTSQSLTDGRKEELLWKRWRCCSFLIKISLSEVDTGYSRGREQDISGYKRSRWPL